MSYLKFPKVAAILQQHLTNLRLGKYTNATIFFREKEREREDVQVPPWKAASETEAWATQCCIQDTNTYILPEANALCIPVTYATS